MKKKVNLIGLVFAVALVALASSWLNNVEVNATTVTDYLKTVGDSISERVAGYREPASETVILDDAVPLATVEDVIAIEIVDETPAAPAANEGYLAELETTREVLKETQEMLAELKAEIELLKSTPNETSEAEEEIAEEDEDETDAEEEKDVTVTIEPEQVPLSPAPESGSPAQAELTEAQRWQQEFAAYQEWAKQYEVKE